MTREEALEELDLLIIPRDGEQDKLADAFDMAIKALEQEPCEDAISRQAVNTLLDELARAISDERCCISRGNRSTATIMRDICHLPPVTPQPKTGTWGCGDDIFEYAICSKCKYDTGEPWEYAKKNFKYCPNCGAKMIEAQEESHER